jgi:SAM-dependent methyltransferase
MRLGRQETWDRVASSGRDELIGDPQSGERELRDLFGRLGGPPAGARCLEIGCGTGRMTVPLGRQFKEVLAVDVSPMMIERARAAVDVGGVPGVRFQLVPGDTLEGVPDGWADVLVCYLVLQHFPTKENVVSYLAEFERVLARSGEAFVQLPVLASGMKKTARRTIRHALVRLQAPFSTNPRAGLSYRGFRLTGDELWRALDHRDLEVIRVHRDPTSSYHNCEDVFLRLRRPPDS